MREFGKEAEVVYLALIGDLVGSRRSRDRAELQRRLREVLDGLNRRFRQRALAARLRVVAGDEFQGLFVQPDAVVDVVVAAAEALHPSPIAFGIGLGTLATGPLPRAPRVEELDGPCFHHAREGLEHAQREEIFAAARGFGAAEDELLSSLLEMTGEVRRAWTERQCAVARAMRGPRTRAASPILRTQKEVAAELEVQPSTISESLKAARFASLVRADQALARFLGNFGPITEAAANSAKEAKR